MNGAALRLSRRDYGCCNTMLAAQQGLPPADVLLELRIASDTLDVLEALFSSITAALDGIERQLDAGAFVMSREDALTAGFLSPHEEPDTVIVSVQEAV